MNIEETIEAIRVMQAYVDGRAIEYEMFKDTQWRPEDKPHWNWLNNTYRIKPTATLRPWTADEVPLGMQARKKSDPTRRWLIGNTADELVRTDWSKELEHSIDCGKTWHPCGVMEEAK
jgi:hypothetical protein